MVMTPEGHHHRIGMNNQRYEGDIDNDNDKDQQVDLVNLVYGDLVDRIDRFLAETISTSKIREGTKERVQESINVIQEALKRYEYPISYLPSTN